MRGRRINLAKLGQLSERPALYSGRDKSFWTDPYVSRHVLDAHLDPHTDDASRRPAQIAATVEAVMRHLGTHPPGAAVLDLACGPGLYAEQFAARGMQVTGLDFSGVSLAYARKQAEKQGLAISYVEADLTRATLGGPYDLVTMIYGEFCTLSELERRELLNRVYESLAPGGLFVFDVFTEAYVKRNRSTDEWYVSSRDGFWQKGAHLVLLNHYFYAPDAASVAHYILVDEAGTYRTFNVWWRHFGRDEIRDFVTEVGFQVEAVYANLWGEPFDETGEWIGLYVRKQR